MKYSNFTPQNFSAKKKPQKITKKTLKKHETTQKTKPVTSTTTKSSTATRSTRNWAFTVANPLEDGSDDPKFWLPSNMFHSYASQKEIAPTSGKAHIQGVVCWKTALNLSQVLKFAPESCKVDNPQFNHRKKESATNRKKIIVNNKVHWEPCEASLAKNIRYVLKQTPGTVLNSQSSYGSLSKKQGQRSDMIALKEYMLEHPNAPMKDISERFFTLYMRYPNSIANFKLLHSPSRDFKTEVTFCYGESGSGKTLFCRTIASAYGTKNYFIKDPTNKWFDGYNGSENMIIDDFYGGISHAFILRLFDQFKMTLEIKGSTISMLGERIFITSNKWYLFWYEAAQANCSKQELEFRFEALFRRFDNVLIFLKNRKVVIFKGKVPHVDGFQVQKNTNNESQMRGMINHNAMNKKKGAVVDLFQKEFQFRKSGDFQAESNESDKDSTLNDSLLEMIKEGRSKDLSRYFMLDSMDLNDRVVQDPVLSPSFTARDRYERNALIQPPVSPDRRYTIDSDDDDHEEYLNLPFTCSSGSYSSPIREETNNSSSLNTILSDDDSSNRDNNSTTPPPEICNQQNSLYSQESLDYLNNNDDPFCYRNSPMNSDIGDSIEREGEASPFSDSVDDIQNDESLLFSSSAEEEEDSFVNQEDIDFLNDKEFDSSEDTTNDYSFYRSYDNEKNSKQRMTDNKEKKEEIQVDERGFPVNFNHYKKPSKSSFTQSGVANHSHTDARHFSYKKFFKGDSHSPVASSKDYSSSSSKESSSQVQDTMRGSSSSSSYSTIEEDDNNDVIFIGNNHNNTQNNNNTRFKRNDTNNKYNKYNKNYNNYNNNNNYQNSSNTSSYRRQMSVQHSTPRSQYPTQKSISSYLNPVDLSDEEEDYTHHSYRVKSEYHSDDENEDDGFDDISDNDDYDDRFDDMAPSENYIDYQNFNASKTQKNYFSPRSCYKTSNRRERYTPSNAQQYTTSMPFKRRLVQHNTNTNDMEEIGEFSEDEE